MIKNICSALVVLSLLFSCSSDKDDDAASGSDAIIGTWDAIELRIDTNTASDEAKFGMQILDELTLKDCIILTLQFNQDLTTSAISGANYIEVNANATGLDVPCPTELDRENSTYTYDGTTLTIVDNEGEVVQIRVKVSGNEMAVNADDLDIENFDDSGDLIFVKR